MAELEIDLSPAEAEYDPAQPQQAVHDAVAADFPSADAPAAAPTASEHAAGEHAATEKGPDAAAVEPDAEAKLASFRKFVNFVECFTAPRALSPQWDFLGKTDGRSRIEGSPTDLMSGLEMEYGVETLVKLGLYERDGDELRLPACFDNDAPLYVKTNEDKSTLAFCNDDDFLFPMTRTALDYALQRRPAEEQGPPLDLYVCETPEDAEVLQQLGMRAVSCDGLEAIVGEMPHKLFSGDFRTDDFWNYYLVLVDFDVVNLKNGRMLAIAKIIDVLADIQSVYGFDPSRRFGVARPTPKAFRILERAVKFADRLAIRRLLEEICNSAKEARITNWRSHFDSEAVSLSAAMVRLKEALEQPTDLPRTGEITAALHLVRQAQKQSILDKFNAAMEAATDPFQMCHLMAAADNAELYLDSHPLVRRPEAELAGEDPRPERGLDDELFSKRRKCFDEIRRIGRDFKPKRRIS